MSKSQNIHKDAGDLDTKRFSRYGEFLVSFELSKNGWNVYNPVYDEYIDFVIHKHSCKLCGKGWDMTPSLVCKKCGKDFSTAEKKNIIPILCKKCGKVTKGNKQSCSECGSTDIIKRPTCDKCHGEIEMKKHSCECGSNKYQTKFRTIQVKSSRIENKSSFAINMKPRDLIEDDYHFYIWCLVDNKDKPHFLVISVKDFKDTMDDSMNTVAFFKDQDRQHFSAKNFGKWSYFDGKFDKLDI